MPKILVADDEEDQEELIMQKFSNKDYLREYEFLFARDGLKALQLIKNHLDIDIALLDINMPEMDGLTLLNKLNETRPLLKSVIVSAYGDMENIRTAMNRGAFDFITKPVNFEDLELTMEKTIRQVAQMRETLKAIKEINILRKYVDEAVLNFMNSREYESSLMVNETVEATVAFIDICSFTTISENEDPDTVVRLLNNFFDVMVKEIIAQDGHIDKFIGDAIMAVFRGDYHLDRAIEACISVRNRISAMPKDFSSIGFMPQVSIGINSGELISGNIGSADLRRLDFTVVGDVVNTASRLQSTAKPGQIIIPESAYQKVKGSFDCRLLQSVSLKNKAIPLNIYEVVD